jgi:hypothetical protein
MRAYDYIPTREMIADAMGLRREASPFVDSTSALMIFAAGALFGTALALLFAPRPGEELRADLRQRVSNLRQRAGAEAKEPPTLSQM